MPDHRLTALLFAACLACAPAVFADDAEKKGAEDDKPSAEKQVEMIDAAAPGFVVVEWTPQYDQGEAPQGFGGTYGVEQNMTDRRPVEVPGVLVADDLVITNDPQHERRFVKKVEVRFGDDVVPAAFDGVYVDQDLIRLKLDRPLKSARPLAFDAAADAEPAFAAAGAGGAMHGGSGPDWLVAVEPYTARVARYLPFDGEPMTVLSLPQGTVLLDKDGQAITIAGRTRAEADADWKRPPAEWAFLDAEAYDKLLAEAGEAAAGGVRRVVLNFRSPKKDAEQGMGMGYSRYDQVTAATELQGLGVVLGPDKVLVNLGLDAETTARLERVRIYGGDGKPVEAEFVGTLRDWNAMIVKPKQPLDGALPVHDGSLRGLYYTLLPKAKVFVLGEERIARTMHDRIDGFTYGKDRAVLPTTMADATSAYLFSRDGALVALPMTRRERFSNPNEYYGYYNNSGGLIPAGLIADALDGEDPFDPDNTPRGEDEESRVAWMGVELQPLDAELARANEIAELTQGGQFGGLVTYVYPESPAAEAGVEPGMVLLWLEVDDHPKPLLAQVESGGFAYGGNIPWDRWDEIPEQYFDQLPTPWPSVGGGINETITQIGFDQPYTATFHTDDGRVTKRFKAVESPAHYGNAARHKNEELGITVREMTYEVRRQLQKQPDDPGVVISKIEVGSKASVAGVKPFEVITEVNGKRVTNVEQFEELIEEAGTEVRLSINRMARNRQVKVQLDAKPAEEAGEDDAGEDDAGEDDAGGAPTGEASSDAEAEADPGSEAIGD